MLAPHVDLDLGPRLGQAGTDVPHADAHAETGRERTAGDPSDNLSVPDDRASLTRNAWIGELEGHELLVGSVCLLLTQPLGPDEVLVECACPSESRFDWRALGRDVIAVEGVADLDPKRVARAKARRARSLVHEHFPDPLGILRPQQELDTVLARVAGAANQGRCAGDGSLRKAKTRGQVRSLEMRFE